MATVIIVAGTCGVGKSTTSAKLQEHYHAAFLEGDELHSQANINKMSNNIPLTDDDRWKWLKQVSEKSMILALENPNKISLVSCSALKKNYRDYIQALFPNIKFLFVFLYSEFNELIKRMETRKGHYMKASMIQSQFDILELPEEDETRAFVIDVSHKTLEEVTDLSIKWIDTQI